MIASYEEALRELQSLEEAAYEDCPDGDFSYSELVEALMPDLTPALRPKIAQRVLGHVPDWALPTHECQEEVVGSTKGCARCAYEQGALV